MNSSHVCCIDDNDTNLKLLEKLLQKDYQVSLIHQPELAMAKLQELKPDLILLDVDMPVLNGYQLCEQIRQCSDLCDTAVVFVSCLVSLEDRLKGYAAGGDGYVTKPFDLRELKMIVHSHLMRKKQVDETKSNLNQLQQLTWTMLKNTSELGEVLNFSRGLSLVRDEQSLVEKLFATVSALELSATLLIKVAFGECVVRNDGKPFSLMEKELLDLAQHGGRITSTGNKYIFKSPNLVLLVRNMPVADENLLGRLKDHMCVLLDTAEAGIEIINREKQKEQLVEARVMELMEVVRHEFVEMEHATEAIYKASSAGFEKLADALEQAFMFMDLTETQEQQISGFIRQARTEIDHQHDLKSRLQDAMERILSQLIALRPDEFANDIDHPA